MARKDFAEKHPEIVARFARVSLDSFADYNAHNNAVREYFRHRPGALLVLNVAAPDAYRRLCEFLGKPGLDRPFPWVNRSSDAAGGPG